MRIRATVAAVSGALAFSALAVPAAQADDIRPSSADHGFTALTSAKTSKATKAPKIKITKATVNGGKPIVLGTSAKKKVSFSVTASDPSGIGGAAAFIWVGKNMNSGFGFGPDEKGFSCKAANATTTTCKGTITANPKELLNAHATTWKVGVVAVNMEGEELQRDSVAKVKLQRLSKLTANASPEPVKKGKTITVTGKLTRANWETVKYQGYGKQSVKLQFKKKGAKTYKNIKTIKSSANGSLKTTVKATVDGHWRYSFAGTASTPAVVSAADYLDVK
ncbi:DUF5707 domain-containing protein [Streptomyces sp. NPDC059452]|uniref:DUF5707 domain-containing protein n=1 Tax=Streptomyces sp. NPDC059452 TaxID=3346835 RepID=UPI0036CB0237